jgi:hypothetical protein
VYLFQVIEHIWMAFARTAAAPSNQALAKTKNFGRMSVEYIRVAMQEVVTAISSFCTKFISNEPWTIIPSITPVELNPGAQEKKRIEELLAAAVSANQQNGKHKRPEPTGNKPGDANTNSNNSNGRGGGGGSGKRRGAVRHPSSAKTANRKKLGIVSPIENKALTPAILMLKDFGLENTKGYCFDWICTGRECQRGYQCKFDHVTFTSMLEGDRWKLLKHMADTKCATLNPALAITIQGLLLSFWTI